MKRARCDPAYYGIVFGLRKSDDEIKDEFLMVDEDGFLQASGNVHKIRTLVEKTISVINRCYNALVTAHNGCLDGSCEFNGMQYHVIAELNVHPTRDSRWGRDVLSFVKARASEMFFACQTVTSVPALAKHICLAPRVPILMKGEKLAATIGFQITVGQSIDGVADKRAKLKRDPAFYRIDFLGQVMKKFRTTDMPSLKRKIINNKTEWGEFIECMSGTSFDTQYKKAADIYRTETCSL